MHFMPSTPRLLPVIFLLLLGAFIALQVERIIKVVLQPEHRENIQVILDARVAHDDVFQVYYLPAGTTDFADINSVRLEVNAAAESQLLVFDLPLDSIGGLRIDIGQELGQKAILLHEVLLRKGDRETIIPFGALEENFELNQYIRLETAELQLLQVEGVYDPFLVLKPESLALSGLYNSYFPNLTLLKGSVILLLLGIFLVGGSMKKSAFYKGAFLNLIVSCAVYFVILHLLTHYRANEGYAADNVTVTVKAKLHSPDVFQLFYTTLEETDFTERNSIRQSVEAKDGIQKIKFNLADTIHVRQLRLDVGENVAQQEVQLQSITIEHNGRVLEMLTSNALKHMHANDYLDVSFGQLVSLKPRAVLGNYDPYLYSGDIASHYKPVLSARRIYPVAETMAALISLALLLFLQAAYPKSVVAREQLLPVAVSFSFVLLLLLPYLKSNFWRQSAHENHENRLLASMPAVDPANLSAYPQAFTAYFNDNFGYRSELIEFGRAIRLGLFKESYMPEKVALGREGWLFLSGEYDNIVDDYARRNLYDSAELKQIVNQTLVKKEYVEAKGAKFYKVFYPNAHSIYAELLPYQILIQKIDTLTRADQVNEYLHKRNTGFQVIDVRDEVLAAKKEVQVYFKYDTHWNSYGAFIGYRKLFSEMAKDLPALKPSTITDYNISWKLEAGGDLLNMMGIRNQEDYKELKPHFTLVSPTPGVPLTEAEGPYPNSIVHENPNDTTGLAAVIFHDSFTIAMRQFISPHFKKVVYCWGSFNQQVIENEKPDVVIEGNTERLFH